ncbi:GGDEF domain-containing protein [Psychromonas sp. psych-6C06]|uniref:EAL domain-containing protein n=1 Tax=Psychromonas sp. psych-6C06 TaxID=2058089 RepID=UPI000C338E09|nr:EAL domain-containing protein [Psychromonas sp. psych-6C06]PKF61087.1 GGDEF domain-containing protein [Psychromonas sp. psych-6C06]
MNEYKKSLWLSNIIVLLFAVLATFACKITFNELLIQQQELTAKKINTNIGTSPLDLTALDSLVAQNLFDYIKISHSELNTPLIYENEQLSPIDYYLGQIAPTTFISDNGAQLIEYKTKNSKLIALIKQVLFVIYSTLILMSLMINILYYRLFKRIEKTLIKEIADDSDAVSPFTKVSEQLHEQKRLFHRALQNQEKQILQLAHQVNMDNLTGLNNRHAFRKELTDILSNEEDQQHAILSIIRASELNTINAQRGFQHGDEYIISIANLISKVAERYPATSLYRISGSDFALIARDMSISDAQVLAKNLKMQFDQYQALNKLDSIAYNGISSIISGQLPEQVLARTDMALAKAQTEGVNNWAFEQQDSDDSQFGQQHWRNIIEDIITKRALMLLHQPIQAIHRNMKGYQEIFTRFIGENNSMIPTDTVFAMAQRVDLSVKLEQLILETVVSQCRHKTDGSTRWGINITSSAIQNSSFIVWLERLLLRESNIAASLIFEMQEVVLDSNLVASKRVFDMLKRTGSRSAICNFGKGIGSFRLFKELKPDFVKIDASLISNIERDSANQQFVRMIIDVAHRMDCRVIAEGIEHLEQKQILENMYIDGVQGFLIARPSPL